MLMRRISIQAISGYTGAGDLDIQDDAADLISAGDAVLNHDRCRSNIY